MNPDRTTERAALALAGAATGALAYAWISRRKQLATDPAADSHKTTTLETQHAGGLTVAADALQDDIMREQFTRNIQFFGDAAQAKVFGSFVVIVGLGGVGSHAATMLLRSGVGKLRLIDFDQVSVSSLNRHAVATREDVGMSKADCLKRHFRRIAPEAELETINAMYSQDSSNRLLSGSPDFVLDAIDNLETKAALIAACKQRNIPILCVAGAGAKADPTRLRIGDLSDAGTDPLARTVRRSLRKKHGIVEGVPTLLSVEAPRCQLMSVDALPGSPQDFQIIPNFRVRTIPVLGPMPAMFGMAAASFILCQLAGKPFRPEPIFTMQGKQYTALLDRLRQTEELVYGNTDSLDVDVEDVAYLAREVWRGLSAKGPRFVPMGTDKGRNRPTDQLTLTRWDCGRLPATDNLVLLSFDEAEQHEASNLADIKQQEPEYFAYVNGVLASL